MRAYSSPFNQGGGLCLPVNPSPPTQKVVTYIRGTCYTGTMGTGFIQVIPNASNDTPCVYFSDPTFAGISTAVVGTGVLNTANSQAQYANALFRDAASTGLQQRMVLAALRIKYKGTELNRGGTIAAFTDSMHSSTDGMSMTSALAIPALATSSVTDRWSTIRWSPMGSSETDFSNFSRPQLLGAANIIPQLAVVFESTASNPFSFELVMYHEILGQRFNLSNSHATPHSSTVLAAANDVGKQTAQDGGLFAAVRDNAPAVAEHLGGGYAFMQGAAKAANYAKSYIRPIATGILEAGEAAAPYLALA